MERYFKSIFLKINLLFLFFAINLNKEKRLFLIYKQP